MSLEVGNLGTTLFVLGFATGPVIWAPASELRGRKWPLTIAILSGAVFTTGSAVSENIQTLVVCRFLAGVCGAGPLTVVPGVLADIFDNTYRGVAITVYALAVFVGPSMGPFIGGFVTASSLGWRWTLYIPAILGFVDGGLAVLFLPETYAPCLLVERAVALRRKMNYWGIHAEQEKRQPDVAEMFDRYLSRPLKMLATEPILLCISLYMSFIYGIVYALLEAYPYVFEHTYGMSPWVAGLTFFGLIIGECLAIGYVLSLHSAYNKKLVKNLNVPVPEWRLVPTFLGAPSFAIGIFW